MNQSYYFYCYDKQLYQFIKSYNIEYITKARRLDNLAIFTMYERTNELNQVINDFMKTN